MVALPHSPQLEPLKTCRVSRSKSTRTFFAKHRLDDIALVGADVSRPALHDIKHVLRCVHDALGQQESCRQVRVVPRRSA